MIPLNIEDTTVLRRTLEEIESRLIEIPAPLRLISELTYVDGVTTLEDVLVKVNEIVVALNTVNAVLNATDNNID